MKEGSKQYKALLDEALTLHLNKNTGYSADDPDAFSNFRLAEGMGLTPLQGVMVRLGDKFARAQSLMRNPDNDKVGESLRDTLMDLSAYALIGICLMEEDKQHSTVFDPNWIAKDDVGFGDVIDELIETHLNPDTGFYTQCEAKCPGWDHNEWARARCERQEGHKGPHSHSKAPAWWWE